MFRRTTSMPTPRPDTSVTWSAVENPGSKINWNTSWSVICVVHGQTALQRLAIDLLARQAATVVAHLDRDRAALVLADRVIVPLAGLPLRGALLRRSSMPWSSALRTRCVSGSVIFSTMPLSSSVASPIGVQLDLLAELAGQVAQHPRKAIEDHRHRDHADRHHRFLQRARVALQVDQGPSAAGGRSGPGCGRSAPASPA
jgi:hypothetical protein